jgi:hypothetical protein
MRTQIKTGFENSFGMWKRKAVDGVRYQEDLRAEWAVEVEVAALGSRVARITHSCDETA